MYQCVSCELQSIYTIFSKSFEIYNFKHKFLTIFQRFFKSFFNIEKHTIFNKSFYYLCFIFLIVIGLFLNIFFK